MNDIQRFGNGKTECLAQIVRRHFGRPIERLLVVGCGTGEEAAILHQELKCEVVGIDLKGSFDARAAAAVHLEKGDATAMRFDDASFGYVYSYHALEHIPAYRIALQEMRRVLQPGGGYCVGTPNRIRLLGYLGSRQVPLAKKVAWNAADWKMRLSGRFRNEFGAHAGFSSRELRDNLAAVFSTVIEISPEYYLAVYRRHARAIRAIYRSGAGRFVFPSIYFVGSR